MTGRVTIKSLAEDLGVSHMTVSRALSDHPNVQPGTREMIRARAQELGYVKSAAAIAMRGDSTGIVGLVLPNIANEFYARFANAMAEACEARAWQLVVHLTNDNLELEHQAIRRLREIEASALILVPAPGSPRATVSRFGSMRVIQLIRERAMETPSAAILVNDHDALHDAVGHLAGQGHTTIGYIGAGANLSSGRRRLKAFRAGLAAVGIAERDECVIQGTPTFALGRDAADRLLERGTATALVCGGFEVSNGALSTLMEHSAFHDGSFGFVGYGDPSFYAWVNGGITTLHVPVDELAGQAAAMLDRDIFPETGRKRVTRSFDAQLRIREGNDG